jgi:cation diffusion facilitator family transporter
MPPAADSPATRPSAYQDATQAALLGLVVNLALGLIKLVGGLIASSFALVADAVNSLGDVFSSVVVLVALRVAQRPPDEEHPYGHSRAEAIAGSNVALLVIVSALYVGYEAVRRLTATHELPPAWTLWIAAANAVIKEALYRYKMVVGRRTGSSAVIANAWDHRSDAMCSLAVFVGLMVVRLGGPRWIWADEAAAFVVVTMILWSGAVLFRKSASELMDVQADDELVRRIRQSASSVPGVAGIEKLLVRKSGLEFLADMHMEVDPQMSVAEGHAIGHDVKDRLLKQFPLLRDVLVHLEPAGHDG